MAEIIEKVAMLKAQFDYFPREFVWRGKTITVEYRSASWIDPRGGICFHCRSTTGEHFNICHARDGAWWIQVER